MAIETFSWCPRINAEADTTFRTRKAGPHRQAQASDNLRLSSWFKCLYERCFKIKFPGAQPGGFIGIGRRVKHPKPGMDA